MRAFCEPQHRVRVPPTAQPLPQLPPSQRGPGALFTGLNLRVNQASTYQAPTLQGCSRRQERTCEQAETPEVTVLTLQRGETRTKSYIYTHIKGQVGYVDNSKFFEQKEKTRETGNVMGQEESYSLHRDGGLNSQILTVFLRWSQEDSCWTGRAVRESSTALALAAGWREVPGEVGKAGRDGADRGVSCTRLADTQEAAGFVTCTPERGLRCSCDSGAQYTADIRVLGLDEGQEGTKDRAPGSFDAGRMGRRGELVCRKPGLPRWRLRINRGWHAGTGVALTSAAVGGWGGTSLTALVD